MCLYTSYCGKSLQGYFAQNFNAGHSLRQCLILLVQEIQNSGMLCGTKV